MKTNFKIDTERYEICPPRAISEDEFYNTSFLPCTDEPEPPPDMEEEEDDDWDGMSVVGIDSDGCRIWG